MRSPILALALLAGCPKKAPPPPPPPDAPAEVLAHAYGGDGELSWYLCSEAPEPADAARIDARVKALGLGTAAAQGEGVRVTLSGVATDTIRRSFMEEELFRRRGELRVAPPKDLDATIRPGAPLPELGRTVVANEHIVSARVVEVRGNPPLQVLVELDEAGRQSLGIWMTTHVMERLVILVDGRLHAAPIVEEPITTGRLSLTAGDAREARGLAAALSHPLQADWTLCAPPGG